MKKVLNKLVRKQDPPLEKFHFFFLWFVRITLIIALYRSLLSENWQIVGIVIFACILTFLARGIEQRYNIDIPIEFEIGLILLVYGSIFLGELQGYYTTYWWWDLALHTLTGAMIGLVGFLALLLLSRRKHLSAAPGSIALFAFSLAAAAGGLWEIFEFCMDQAFGLNMQKSGLVDTMGDLMVNNLGALGAALAGYLYLKSGEVSVLNAFIQRFKKGNPHIARDVPQKE